MTVKRAREILGKDNANLSDQEVEKYCEITNILANLFMENIIPNIIKPIDTYGKIKQ